jgi:hypothetical protein
MNIQDPILKWLLGGDPSIRFQVYQDLLKASQQNLNQEQEQIARKGWGNRLLALQDPEGTWAKGLYSPKWKSTTYTLLLLWRLQLAPGNPGVRKACQLLIDNGFQPDGGIDLSRTLHHSETCITGMILTLFSYFNIQDERLPHIVDYLLREQLVDGGWNCLACRGAHHSSFHTTITVLEALHEFGQRFGDACGKIDAARRKAHEFLLIHRLFRSHRTGKVAHPSFTRLPFPPRWHYDILRGLDYFQRSDVPFDNRMHDALEILLKKRTTTGYWLLQQSYPGRVFFEMEPAGQPSRWNTLRALRVLDRYQPDTC